MTSENGTILVPVKRVKPTLAYRTLGVHIAPLGCSKGAMPVLMESALQYCSLLTSSKLSRQEALTIYVQCLLPKLRYQPPLLCMTRHDCDKILSPILMALLPKLHLNRHTSRAIVHGPEEFGGLALPHLPTLQGVDKLKLFLGHLRLQDRTGHLIHIDMTYVQLLTGTSMLFLNQDPAEYEWVESGWLTSLWTFINGSKLTITYPLAWKPNLLREHDRTLMDYFVNKGLQNKTLESINICRLYLQVITLSNVVAANGQTILLSCKVGHPLSSRVSKLSWPVQGRPPNAERKIWASHLDE